MKAGIRGFRGDDLREATYITSHVMPMPKSMTLSNDPPQRESCTGSCIIVELKATVTYGNATLKALSSNLMRTQYRYFMEQQWWSPWFANKLLVEICQKVYLALPRRAGWSSCMAPQSLLTCWIDSCLTFSSEAFNNVRLARLEFQTPLHSRFEEIGIRIQSSW